MTPEQQAAFVFSQSVCAQAEIAAMQAENEMAKLSKALPIYNGDDFRELLTKYSLTHKAVMILFAGGRLSS